MTLDCQPVELLTELNIRTVSKYEAGTVGPGANGAGLILPSPLADFGFGPGPDCGLIRLTFVGELMYTLTSREPSLG